MAKCNAIYRFLLSITAIILILWTILAGDLLNRLSFRKSPSPDFPDFSHYDNFTHTLSGEQFPTNDNDRRIIAIGDIHGMNESLTALLNRISYDVQKDTLIHLGDITTKSAVEDSLAVVSFLENNKILGVRGNNDQKVLEWRAWMDWILSQPGGREWLREVDDHWPDYELLPENGDMSSFDSYPSSMKEPDWEKKIPKGWKLLGDHYQVARAMSRSQYNYLKSLPLVLHAPAGHVFFVHAGLLAADPSRILTHPKQPLSHWPSLEQSEHNIPAIREAQELALLSDIPQNQDPWVVLNIRGVRKNGKPTRNNNKGIPYSELWNKVMNKCSGFDASNARFSSLARLAGHRESQLAQLPCYPSTVVYGHAATRGLDVKRWSVGLDTGCTYGRRLSALVLDAKSFPSRNHTFDLPGHVSPGAVQQHTFDSLSSATDSRIKFGHAGEARIISVECH
jgi:calcineurin-like phosphoesterase family protein